MNPCHHSAPSTGFNQTENWNKQRAKPDKEKLQNFIENRRKQATCRDINSYRQL